MDAEQIQFSQFPNKHESGMVNRGLQEGHHEVLEDILHIKEDWTQALGALREEAHIL